MYFLFHKRADDAVFNDFPKNTEDFPKFFRRLDERFQTFTEHFRTFYEDYRRLTKIAEDDRRKSEDIAHQQILV